MGIAIILFIIFVIVAIYIISEKPKNDISEKIYIYKEKKEKEEEIIPRYYKYLKAKDYIFTKNENIFFRQLEEALENENVRIFTQVDIKNIIKIKKMWGYQRALWKIQGKHIDFVITTKNGKILCCIELDDGSHDTEEAQKRDDDKDRFLEYVGIKLFRKRKKPYKFDDIIEYIRNKQKWL